MLANMGLIRTPGCSSILATGLNSRRQHSPASIRVSATAHAKCREYKFDCKCYALEHISALNCGQFRVTDIS